MKGGAGLDRNNFDFLRVILASTVVLFHVSALTGLPAFAILSQYGSAHFAFRAFFVISGMLIYRSYIRSSTVASYFEKRARRIYPAYFVTIVVAAVALCLLSTMPPSVYFGLSFWKYLGANLLFLNFLAPTLPGVFESNILPAVDGALWTLKIEVIFYLFVPLLHYLCNRFGTGLAVGVMFLLSSTWKYGLLWLAVLHNGGVPYNDGAPRNIYQKLAVQFPSQLVYFLAVILLLLYFDKLKLHFRIILALTFAFFLIDYFFAIENLDVLWISGFVFIFAFWHYFGNFAKHGDFSYGLYIVHWPILQTFVALELAKHSPAVFFLVSISATILVSVLMWNLVESRFLSRANRYRHASVGKTA